MKNTFDMTESEWQFEQAVARVKTALKPDHVPEYAIRAFVKTASVETILKSSIRDIRQVAGML